VHHAGQKLSPVASAFKQHLQRSMDER